MLKLHEVKYILSRTDSIKILGDYTFRPNDEDCILSFSTATNKSNFLYEYSEREPFTSQDRDFVIWRMVWKAK
jgi:hypothetical protein